MVPAPIRTITVDDHPFVSDWFKTRLEREGDFQCVKCLPNAENLVWEIEQAQAKIVVIDIMMPGPDPFETIDDVRRRCSDVKTVVWSAAVRDHYVEAAIQAGASGYFCKSEDPAVVVQGLRKIAKGQIAFGPSVLERCRINGNGVAPTKMPEPETKLNALSAREQQVLRLIGRGMSRTEIAKSLHRSPKTVDKHRAAIMEKLDIHDRVELVRYAIREGIVEA